MRACEVATRKHLDVPHRGEDVKTEIIRSPNDHEHAPYWINQVFEREGNGGYETIFLIRNINESRTINTRLILGMFVLCLFLYFVLLFFMFFFGGGGMEKGQRFIWISQWNSLVKILFSFLL